MLKIHCVINHTIMGHYVICITILPKLFGWCQIFNSAAHLITNYRAFKISYIEKVKITWSQTISNVSEIIGYFTYFLIHRLFKHVSPHYKKYNIFLWSQFRNLFSRRENCGFKTIFYLTSFNWTILIQNWANMNCNNNFLSKIFKEKCCDF